MAKSMFNVITYGLSGLVGNLLVFRQRHGKTVVANRPRKSTKPPKPNQIKNERNFTRAAKYAYSVMSNETLKQQYARAAKLGQSAFNVAFADYFKSPEFYDDVQLGHYTGLVGQKIEVSVIDDFRVNRVEVLIVSSDGELIEQGQAEQTANELDWVYTTTAQIDEVSGVRISFTAFDLPGNKTVLEKTIA